MGDASGRLAWNDFVFVNKRVSKRVASIIQRITKLVFKIYTRNPFPRKYLERLW